MLDIKFVRENPDSDRRDMLEYRFEGGGGLPERLWMTLTLVNDEDGTSKSGEPMALNLTAMGDMETQLQEIGNVVAVITGGYYGGQSLTVEYSVRSPGVVGRYQPTEEQLAQAFMLPDSPEKAIDFWLNGADEAVVAEFKEACARGEEYAVIERHVHAGNGATTDDGLILEDGGDSEQGSYSDSVRRVKRTFALPEEAQGREHLTVAIALVQEAQCLYFDGKDMYMILIKNQEAGCMTATFRKQSNIWR